jgi:hypothetical protein
MVLGCVDAPQRTSSSSNYSGSTDPSPSTLIEPTAIEYTHRWNWSDSGEYFYIEGTVTNVSGQKLNGVKIVVSFFDDQKSFVSSDFTYAEFDPLMPGQTAPYKLMMPKNPAIDTYQVAFAARDGAQLKAMAKMQPQTEKRKKR